MAAFVVAALLVGASGHSAIADPIRTISGTIKLNTNTAGDMVAPAGAVSVQWTVVGGTHDADDFVLNDASGNYSIGGLEPGTYWLRFEYLGAAGYYSEWYGQYPYAAQPPATPSSNYVSVSTADQDVDVELVQKGSFSGVVKFGDAVGPTVPAGSVEVSYQMRSPEPGEGDVWGAFSTPVLTAAGGAFLLSNIPPGAFRVQTRYIGADATIEEFRVHPDGSNVYLSNGANSNSNHLILRYRASASGTVSVGTAGVFAPGGQITVDVAQLQPDGTYQALPTLTTTLGSNGQFMFTGLNPVLHRFTLSYSGPGDFASTFVGYGVPGAALAFVIPAAYSISGHVDLLNTGSSATAGSVEVTLKLYPAGGEPVATVPVGPGGDYHFTKIPAGTYNLEFRYLGEEDFPTWYWGTSPVGGAPTPGNITPINLSSNRTGLNVVIGQGVGLFGTITDQAGDPVAGAELRLSIYLKSDGSFYQARTTTSESDGGYQFVSLYSNTVYVLDIFTDDYAPQTWPGYSLYYFPGIMDLQGQQVHGVDQTLQLDASISGTVSAANPASLNLAGATATAVIWVYDYELEQYVDTGDSYPVAADGTYSIPDLYPDGYKVRLVYTGPGGHPNLLSPVIDLDEDEDATQHYWLAQGASHASTFADVPSNHAFSREIEWMFNNKITTGYIEPTGQRTYHSSEDVSRQAMAAFLYRTAGSPAFVPPSTPSFTDVPTDHPFYLQIEWMKQQTITTGNLESDGTYTYRPLDPVSRQAMAAFLYRFAGRPTFDPESSSFSDVTIGAPFAKEIEWLKQEGISNGNADGTFHPTEPVSRQAMAAFLYRYSTNGSTATLRARDGFQPDNDAGPGVLTDDSDRSGLVLPLGDSVPVG